MFRKQLISSVLLISLITLGFGRCFSQDIPARPDPPRLVNDFSNVLSSQERETLERKLVAFNDSTSTQIVVVIVNDLGGYDKAEYATALGEKWGVGRKGKNNGVIILVKPTGKQGQRKAHIAVGYGIEALIPDITARGIVQKEMIPEFEQGNYYQGIDNATTAIMGLIKGEFKADAYNGRSSGKGLFSIIFPLIILIIIISIFRPRRNRRTIGSSGLPWLAAMMFMNSGSSSGSWGDFSGGSGGSGGFGGFGGGSFGGGGAGGSW